MFKIGEFSKMAKTTIKTLRYYDETDLLKPSFVDDNGYRYYETEQLSTLIYVVELRNLDVPVSEIKKILNATDKITPLKKHLQFLKGEAVKKQEQISLLEKRLAQAEKGDFMKNYIAKEITVPQNIVYFKHGVIPTMGDLFNFVLSAGTEARKNNPTLKCTNYCYVSYTAHEYKEKDIELEYVEAVEDFGVESETVKFRLDSPINAVSVLHKGKYENLAICYSFALNYVKEKGYEIDGAIREVYVHGCWDVSNEEDYLTEIQIPIKK